MISSDDQCSSPQQAVADGDLFDAMDDAFVKQRRINGWTKILLAALLAVIGFGAGVVVQKNHDAGLMSSPGSGLSAFRARSGSAGAANGAGGAAGGFEGGRSSSGSTGMGGSDSQLPVVVGTVTVVSAARITVTNFAGTAVPVLITPSTVVTIVGATSLTAGLSASVVGTKGADGTVTATAVTVRHRSAS
jgi:hypothetical protein